MNKFKRITHVCALALAAAAAFFVSPAGQAIVHQYPVLSGVSAVVLALATLYHNPARTSLPQSQTADDPKRKLND